MKKKNFFDILIKMIEVNPQTVINFVLFAMLVVAFVFAIWAYVKTNNIKNANSGSVPSVINDNNTFVNNIASAPNLVFMDTDGSVNPYVVLKSTDNGSNVLISGDSTFAGFSTPDSLRGVTDNNHNTIKGYYVKFTNANLSGGSSINLECNNIPGKQNFTVVIAPGQSIYYYQYVSIVPSGTSVIGDVKKIE